MRKQYTNLDGSGTARAVAQNRLGSGYGPYGAGVKRFLSGRRQPSAQVDSTDAIGAEESRERLVSADAGSSRAHGAVGAVYSSEGAPTSRTHLSAAAAPAGLALLTEDASDSDDEPGQLSVVNNKYANFMGGATWTARDERIDEKLHNVSGSGARLREWSFAPFSLRGWLNFLALFALLSGLVMLFAGYPILQYYQKQQLSTFGAYGLGGTNSSGQVPSIDGLPSLVDADTPESAKTRTGSDGKEYTLVFSDEFNTDGRTFWPGDDPFWEAVDLHYWSTGDLEWYDPDAISTQNGNLVINMTEEDIHGLNYRSGMLQSWNKFCFTGGYIEVSVRLPGSNKVIGLWPGVWTLGNLARAGYGASTDGMWPYTYNTCDVGTLANQTWANGTGPAAALHSGSNDYGGTLSYMPGQRTSACTCSGEDHPGPKVSVGRGAPEVDIIEAEVVSVSKSKSYRGAVSQSLQVAPFDDGYQTRNTTPYTTVYDSSNTHINSYKGGIYQQACSGVTYTDDDAYELTNEEFETFGFELWPDEDNGYVTWYAGGEKAWTITSEAVGPNEKVQIGQRVIPDEPMSIVINLAISESFQDHINFDNLEFPTTMLIDYVRVYQREDSQNIGCDPKNRPTAKYIADHPDVYQNPNLTSWSQTSYGVPKNSLIDDC